MSSCCGDGVPYQELFKAPILRVSAPGEGHRQHLARECREGEGSREDEDGNQSSNTSTLHQRSSPSELFSDLVFFLPIHSLARRCPSNDTAADVTVFFVAIFNAWLGDAFFNTRFDSEDMLSRLYVVAGSLPPSLPLPLPVPLSLFVIGRNESRKPRPPSDIATKQTRNRSSLANMLGAFGMAYGTAHDLGTGKHYFAMSYAFVRCILVLRYAFVYASIPTAVSSYQVKCICADRELALCWYWATELTGRCSLIILTFGGPTTSTSTAPLCPPSRGRLCPLRVVVDLLARGPRGAVGLGPVLPRSCC